MASDHRERGFALPWSTTTTAAVTIRRCGSARSPAITSSSISIREKIFRRHGWRGSLRTPGDGCGRGWISSRRSHPYHPGRRERARRRLGVDCSSQYHPRDRRLASGLQFLGNADDWLDLVFTHELTHIVHLDRSKGWARALRTVFGRLPIVFPNLFLPAWQIEGLATYEETTVTGAGRLHERTFQAIAGEAARAGKLEPLDRVNGGLTDWPGGHAPYAYGAQFHEYLADRFGAETLAQLAERTAGRVPFTRVQARLRQSLGTSGAFQARLTISASDAPPEGQLTHRSCTRLRELRAKYHYLLRTPDGFPALND
jgi:hypothetical protein